MGESAFPCAAASKSEPEICWADCARIRHHGCAFRPAYSASLTALPTGTVAGWGGRGCMEGDGILF